MKNTKKSTLVFKSMIHYEYSDLFYFLEMKSDVIIYILRLSMVLHQLCLLHYPISKNPEKRLNSTSMTS